MITTYKTNWSNATGSPFRFTKPLGSSSTPEGLTALSKCGNGTMMNLDSYMNPDKTISTPTLVKYVLLQDYKAKGQNGPQSFSVLFKKGQTIFGRNYTSKYTQEEMASMKMAPPMISTLADGSDPETAMVGSAIFKIPLSMLRIAPITSAPAPSKKYTLLADVLGYCGDGGITLGGKYIFMPMEFPTGVCIKKGETVMGIFHKGGTPFDPNDPTRAYTQQHRPAYLEIWQESNPKVKYNVSPDKVTEATVLSTMLSSSTTNVEGFFEKPANVAIASVFATLLIVGAFNWKKVAEFFKK